MNYRQTQALMTGRASKLRKSPTVAESTLFKLLKDAKINFKFQSPRWHDGQLRIFDFWLPQPHRINIEVDGEYHNAERDAFKDKLMKRARPPRKAPF